VVVGYLMLIRMATKPPIVVMHVRTMRPRPDQGSVDVAFQTGMLTVIKQRIARMIVLRTPTKHGLEAAVAVHRMRTQTKMGWRIVLISVRRTRGRYRPVSVDVGYLTWTPMLTVLLTAKIYALKMRASRRRGSVAVVSAISTST